METITELASYGTTGICIALIIYLGWRDKLYNKTTNNHYQHTEAAFDRLNTTIKENTATQAEIKEVINKCKKYE